MLNVSRVINGVKITSRLDHVYTTRSNMISKLTGSCVLYQSSHPWNKGLKVRYLSKLDQITFVTCVKLP